MFLFLTISMATAAGLSELATGDLVITELMIDPAAVTYYRGQWIELYNASGSEVDLSGLIVDDTGSQSFTISESIVVAAGARALLALRDNTAVNGGLPSVDYRYINLILTAGSGTLRLGYDQVIFDTVSWDGTFPDPSGATLSLDPASVESTANDTGSAWCTAASTYGDGDYGTPGTANDDCPVHISNLTAGDLLVTELMTEPLSVTVFRGQWIEVYNSSAIYVDLMDLTVTDDGSDAFVVDESIQLRPGEYAVLATRDNVLVNGGIDNVAHRWLYGSEMVLSATDELQLSYGATVFDGVDWNPTSFPATSGVAMVLGLPFFDESSNDDAASWCDASLPYGDGDYGTPGSVNGDCVEDTDGDGYTEDVDCDDSDASVWPGASEVCDSVDNDCDGNIDEEAIDTSTFYADIDYDFYGDAGNTVDACDRPNGYRINALDCDDTDSGINPGATETCNDGIDQDCDGSDYATCDMDLSGADLRVYGEAAGERLGYSLDGAGDLDGDGTLDVVIGSRHVQGETAGAVYVLHGGGGLTGTLDASSADAVLTGASGDVAGISVGGGGDINNDGYDDLVIGAIGMGSTAGGAYVVYGPLSGSIDLSTSADALLTGTLAGDSAGKNVASPGDVDGDGFDDVLIGAYVEDTAGVNSGAAYLLYGPVTDMSLAGADAMLVGAAAQDRAGWWVGASGDVDGDGLADVMVSAYRADREIEGNTLSNSGAVYLMYSAVSGSLDLANADAVLLGESAYDQAGTFVTGAGDVNGDGFDDVLVGAEYSDPSGETDAGVTYLVLGPVSGEIELSEAVASFIGESAGDHAGRSASGLGDLDGDGNNDLIIGAKKNDNNGAESGAAYVVLGPHSGAIDLGSADVIYTGELAGDEAGISVVGVGDVDDGGQPDVLIGGYKNDENADESGAAYLIFGERW